MVKFVKSFSKGQITIPKEFREKLGLSDDFWLKIYEEDGKLVAEPMEVKSTLSPAEYAKKLRTISGDWFSLEEYEEMREQVRKRLKRNDKLLRKRS